jgi:hypothetical protein
MDHTVQNANDSTVTTDDKNTTSAWQDEVRAWMSRSPELYVATGTRSSDQCNDRSAVGSGTMETPDVKAAYKAMLEKTRGVDSATVADSLNLFGDLASTGTNASRLANSQRKDNNTETKIGGSEVLEPRVAQAYTSLLQRGLNPVVIVDVLNIAGDVAAIATSPQGRKLFEDMKTLVNHLKG